MPIKQQAKKALRSGVKKQVYNLRRVRPMKKFIKDIRDLVSDKKVTEAKKLLPGAYQAIDKALKSGMIKKNTAARKKSRLSALLKKNS